MASINPYVEAGKFKAIRVDWALDGDELSFALWYAPEVGEVKEEIWLDGTRRGVRVLESVKVDKN